MGRPIDQLLDYMNTVADEKGSTLAQMEKLRNRQRVAPMVLRDVQEQHIQELQKRLIKQRDINAKAQEQQQTVQAESPTAELPMSQPLSTSGNEKTNAMVAQAAEQFGVSPPTSQTTAGPVQQGSGLPGEPTSRQVITTTGDRPNTLGTGSPSANLLWRLGTALTGTSRTPYTTTQEVVNYDRMEEARFNLQQQQVRASTWNDMARTFPAAQIPQAAAAMKQWSETGQVSPEATRGLKSIADQQIELQRSNYANEAAYRQQQLELRRAEVEANKGAAGAASYADNLRAVKLMGDIEAKNRENLRASGTLNTFNLLDAMGGSREGFKTQTVDQFQEAFAASKTEGAWGIAKKSPADLQPAEIKLLADRAANFNYVLVREGNDKDFTFGLRSYDEYIRLMATANAKAYGLPVSPEDQLTAIKQLEADGLLKVNKEGDRIVGVEPIGTGPFANQSQRLWDTYNNYLVGTAPWQQAVKPLAPNGFTGQALPSSPRIGLTPEQERAAELDRQRRLSQAFQLLQQVPEAGAR